MFDVHINNFYEFLLQFGLSITSIDLIDNGLLTYSHNIKL